MGSPPTGVEVGQETTTPLDQIYNFDAISTDPEALLTALQDGSVTPGYEPTSEQLFSVIGSLLSQPELTAEQRATLYEVVGSVEGVELLGDIPDPIGRIGVGFSRVIGPRTQILIFDRATGQPLATEESAADDPSQILEWQAFNPPT